MMKKFKFTLPPQNNEKLNGDKIKRRPQVK
jgi:hypothetical protein